MDIGELFFGSLLSSFFQVLWDRLASLGLNFVQREGIDAHLENVQREGIKAQFENWNKKLQDIYWHLDDAEDRQLFGDRAVKSWLEDARDMAYDMEDLLDEFAIEAAKQEQGAESSMSGGLRKRKWPSFPSLVLDGNMRSKVQNIESRLQDILTRKDRLCLKETVGSRSTSVQDAKRLPSSSLEEPCFVGREKEENEIIQLLTTNVDHTIPTIIPIVGMGGIGKTALAQGVYNNPHVANHFEVKVWTCVSDNFDVPSITKAILQSINPLPCEGKDINWLQVKLKENISGKKFLLVLDDVWNEKYGEWTTLLKPFDSGAEGSKIIITTRNLNVASIAGAPAYPLKELQRDDCIALFAHHALGVNKFNNHPHLEEIGQKIVDKCRGLPLAAKTLGGLLRTKVEPCEWEAILNSMLWDLPEERNEILPILKLSYLHLPSHLKRCFAYCAIFPKDYEIERDKLIHWWMAEGLLGENNGKNRWDIGLNYFDELVSRSFFQQGKGPGYLMHDLIHDMAMSISGATCFNGQELKLEAYENNTFLARSCHASLARARHASFVPKFYVTSKMLRRYHEMKKLRSFVTLGGSSMYYLSQKALHDLVSELKDVRVFSMSHCPITKVPDSICELKHLRHLDFSYTKIQMLPKSIGTIYNLEALLLQGCRKLLELPQEIEKLYNLQYLDIRDTPNLRAMPGNFTNVKMSNWFGVGTLKGPRLKDLKHLIHIKGELFISELQQVEQVQDARDVNLYEKRGIDKLVLEWAEDFNDSRNKEHKNAVLDFLQPHINLKILRILYYGGTRFPPWLGSALYASLVHVALRGCHNVTSLPSLGQLPLLKELCIEGLNSIMNLGNEFYGAGKPFPSLRTLEFCKMLAWETWSYCGGIYEMEAPFNCLEHLIIQDCPKLVGRLPRGLDSLTKLEIYSCPCLEESPHVLSLPSLQVLYLRNCNVGILNSLVDLTSLTTLAISSILELTCFESGFTKSLVKLERLRIEECEKLNYLWRDLDEVQYFTSSKSLSIERCPRLVSLMAMPLHLQELRLVGCDSLPTLEFESDRFPTSLKSLEIVECHGVEVVKLIFGMEHQWIEKISIRECNNLRSLELDVLSHQSIIDCGVLEVVKCFLPLSITMSHFELKNCANIKHLPNNLDQFTSLETLDIDGCENIRCFPEKGLPPNLKSLRVQDCSALEVECFPPLPTTMSHFMLWNCANVKYLPNNLGRLMSLETLDIDGCENIRCLPDGGLPPNLKNLRIVSCGALEVECFPPLPVALSTFYLAGCPNIKYLSNNLHQLMSLENLGIDNCGNIVCLPEGGLPPNLQYFSIMKCKNMKTPMREWGLHRLTSLYILWIDGSIGDVGGMPCFVAPTDDDEDNAWGFLPSSLSDLSIRNMREGERLSSGLCNHLSSLQTLSIVNCSKLRYFPKDGLPPSLESLHVWDCERLKEELLKRNGDCCRLLNEIPCVTINGKEIN